MAEHKLDAKGKRCPLPIVLVAKKVRELSPEDELIVEATDPVFSPDIEAWCRKTKNELIELKEENSTVIARIKICA